MPTSTLQLNSNTPPYLNHSLLFKLQSTDSNYWSTLSNSIKITCIKVLIFCCHRHALVSIGASLVHQSKASHYTIYNEHMIFSYTVIANWGRRTKPSQSSMLRVYWIPRRIKVCVFYITDLLFLSKSSRSIVNTSGKISFIPFRWSVSILFAFCLNSFSSFPLIRTGICMRKS